MNARVHVLLVLRDMISSFSWMAMAVGVSGKFGDAYIVLHEFL